MQELNLPTPPVLETYPSLSAGGLGLIDEQFTNRGFDPSTAQGKRAYRFVNFAAWVGDQFQYKTGHQLTPETLDVATDVSILMALYDDTNDTGEVPDWDRDYAPAIVGPYPGAISLPSVASEFGCPIGFSSNFRASARRVSDERLNVIERSWNDLVIGMHDHKVAAVEGLGSREFILTRVQEAIALSDLFSDIFNEEDTDLYDFIKFKEWFELEMIALNMSNAWFDYKDDQNKDGHKPLGKAGWLAFSLVTADACRKLWVDPLTTSDDRTFFAYYTNRLVVPKWKASLKR